MSQFGIAKERRTALLIGPRQRLIRSRLNTPADLPIGSPPAGRQTGALDRAANGRVARYLIVARAAAAGDQNT